MKKKKEAAFRVGRKQHSYKVALGGVTASLAVFAMFLTGLAPFFTYLCPMIAGAVIMVIVVEASAPWAYATYAAVAVLCVFFTPDKEAAMIFIFFFGHYPILKSILEKMRSRFWEWIIKAAVFNVCVVSCYLVIIKVFGISALLDSLGEWGKYGLLIFMGIANVTFFMFDYCLSVWIQWYAQVFRTKYLRKLK